MRLHRLEVTAFGPYADTQTVDFDALNEAGVFLLTGPTGSGKTSILDAVCFALYSVVPGDREVRGLRSDHAPADRAPRVELELTLGGRRLRVVRTPEWRRPKRRGTGTTKEQASARLFLLDPDGTEHLLSDRAQEVGHELGLMLGMTSEQFMQVVLLPQSGFQTFLKARSDERREVLERLFATQRFSRIEEWMHERAREVRDQATGSLTDVRTTLALLCDRSGSPLPEDLPDPPRAEDAPRLGSWADGLLSELATRVAALAGEADESAELAGRAESVATESRRLHLLAQRHERALADQVQLDDSAQAAEECAAALDADARARQVAPLLPALDRATAKVAAARTHAAHVRETLVRTLHDTPALQDSGPEVEAGALHERLASLREGLMAVRPRADELARCAAEVDQVAGALEAATAARDRVAEDRDVLPRERAALERDHAAVVTRAALLESALQLHDEAATRLDGARLHAELLPQLRAAEDAERRAHGVANEARSHALDLVARRLDGIAAELAAGLQEGEACQVCGSTAHPAPAAPVAVGVTESEQEAAAEDAETARLALEEAREVTAALRTEVAAARLRAAGLDVDQAQAALRAADAAVHDAREAAIERQLLGDRRDDLDRRLAEVTAAHESATAQAADLAARLAAARASLEDAAAVLRDTLAAPAGEPVGRLPQALEDRVTEVDQVLARCDALVEAEAALRSAEGARAEAADEVGAAVLAEGFATPEEARSALLDPGARSDLQRRARAREAALARVAGVLAEPELAELDGPTLPHSAADLAQAEATAAEARRAHARAVAQHEHSHQQLVALRAQVDQLASALATWAPAEAEAATVAELASLVRGTGDNRLRMRLSSYVLAARLDQVLDAANARLTHMRDTRYLLRRTDKARRANAQAGLDLEVLDEWTGEVRPPSSLSGGECFVVSLSLALGLADVIGEESGGIEVDTLFIDEGFGTLDPETLDQVMDRIDELRSGGRAVGVVSHVSELRSRITTQVHVAPSRTGSRIAIAQGDA